MTTKELSLDAINPTKAELETLASNAQDAIMKWNPEDKLSMELFKSRKKELQQARLTIKEQCKAARDDAIRFQEAVIGHEKTLLAEIEPVEDTMKNMLDELKQAEIRKEREAELPERHKMLDEIGDDVTVTDEELLDMDHDAFVAHMNERKAARFEQLQEEARRREAEACRQEELREAEERARIEAKEQAEREAQEKMEAERRAREDAERKLAEEQERIANEAKEREEREKREAEEREREVAERKKREAENTRYQEWLRSHRYFIEKAGTMFVERDGETAKLYKLVDTFTFEDGGA